MRARLWAAALAVGLSLASAPSAAALTLTGVDLLTEPNASFPSMTPIVAGTSIYFQWGVTHGPPFMNLVRYRINSGSTLPMTGDVIVSATWNVTRLSCIGFCAGGEEDWDPSFFLSDGSTMIGWGLADNNAGSVVPLSDSDAGATGVNKNVLDVFGGVGVPPINGATEVFLSFTLRDSGVTGLVRYMGVERTFAWSQTLARTTDLALLLSQDNDSGERYQVNSFRLPDASSVPEPGTLALAALGLTALGFTRRRTQRAI